MSELISEAQLEVWEWKDMLHREIKEMPLGDGLRYLVAKGEHIREELEKKESSTVHKETEVPPTGSRHTGNS